MARTRQISSQEQDVVAEERFSELLLQGFCGMPDHYRLDLCVVLEHVDEAVSMQILARGNTAVLFFEAVRAGTRSAQWGEVMVGRVLLLRTRWYRGVRWLCLFFHEPEDASRVGLALTALVFGGSSWPRWSSGWLYGVDM